MTNPHVVKCEDGSILIEWIFEGARFFISLEPNPAESGWGYVTREIAECGELPEILNITAERKACAKVAEAQCVPSALIEPYQDGWRDAVSEIAAAIRARGVNVEEER